VAQRTQVLYVDDLDGSAADGTVSFGVDGVSYEIDLTKKHAEQFADSLEPYIVAGRRVGSSKRRASVTSTARRRDLAAVRNWARSEGLAISERGRIPTQVLEQFDAAH
jgi:hypothetical protein